MSILPPTAHPSSLASVSIVIVSSLSLRVSLSSPPLKLHREGGEMRYPWLLELYPELVDKYPFLAEKYPHIAAKRSYEKTLGKKSTAPFHQRLYEEDMKRRREREEERLE